MPTNRPIAVTVSPRFSSASFPAGRPSQYLRPSPHNAPPAGPPAGHCRCAALVLPAPSGQVGGMMLGAQDGGGRSNSPNSTRIGRQTFS
jgi:hypothetical protein